MSENDIDKKLRDFLNSDKLNKKIKDSVASNTKNDREMEKFVVEITKNVLIQLYKTMWTRKGFWTSSLKNKST